MKKSLIFLLLCLCISPLYSMDRGGQRLYPLIPVGQLGATNTDEQAHLLTHDFFEKDRQTFANATPPSYRQLYIDQEESETELKKLRDLLTQKEKELAALPDKLPGKLRWLAQQRAEENIKSNATVGGVAIGYYSIAMWFQIAGDPRLWKNNGENTSIVPALNNLFGWVGSQLYAGTQCCCRKPENEN